MLNNLRAKLNNPFVKEVLLAVVLFCLPFLLWAHVWFAEGGPTIINFFGINLHFDFGPQVFYWILISHIIPLLYLLLFSCSNKHRVRYLGVVLFFIVVQSLLEFVIDGYGNFSKEVSVWTSLVISFGIVFIMVQTRYFSVTKLSAILFRPLSAKEVLFILLFLCFIPVWFSRIWVHSDLESSLTLGWLEIGTFGFVTVGTFFWTFSFKAILLVAVVLWFFSTTSWWKYALLSPILITVYQIRTIFISENYLMDEYEIFHALPLLGLVLIVLLALSKNAQEQYLFQAIYQKTYSRLEEKQLVKQQQKQEAIAKAKTKLEALKKEPHKKDMEELLELKRHLEEKLSSKN